MSLGICPDVTLGDSTTTLITPFQTSQLCMFITNAARWALYPPNNDVFWPELIKTQTITLTGGAFQLADVDQHTRMALWSADPRLPTSTAIPIAIGTEDVSGIYPSTTQGAVFAFYMPRTPQYTSIARVDATTYSLDDLVYSRETGRCYQALGAYLGSDYLDPTKWTAQADVPQLLSKAIQCKATSYWQDANNAIDLSAQSSEEAQYELDTAWKRVRHLAGTALLAGYMSAGTWR